MERALNNMKRVLFTCLLACVLSLSSVEGLQQINVPASSVGGAGSPIYSISRTAYNSLSISATTVLPYRRLWGRGAWCSSTVTSPRQPLSISAWRMDMHQTLPTITLYGVAGSDIKLAIATPSSLSKLFPSSSQECLDPEFDINDSISLMFNSSQ